MKKSIALLFSFVALVIFTTVNVAEAQSPKNDKEATKVEQKSDGCCTSGDKTTAVTSVKPGCCTAAAKVEAAQAKSTEAKAGCGPAGKTCGGCSSKAKTQSADQAPVPRR